MKRIFLLTAVLLALVVTGAFAQTTGLRSIESSVTAGLFGNELDASLTVQETGNKPDFSELDSNYLFGGIGNLNQLGNLDVFGATSGDPLWLGFHNAESPWSLFVGTYLLGTPPENVNEVALTTAPGTDADGNPVEYVAEEQVFEGDGTLFDEYEQQAQFIMPLGGMNVGLGVAIAVDNQRDAGSLGTSIGLGGAGESIVSGGGLFDNFTYTSTGYTNTASPPSPEADWSETLSASSANGSTAVVAVSVPVFLDGELSHLLVPTFSFDMTNNSRSYSESYGNGTTAPFAGATFNVDSQEVTNRVTDLSISVPYELVTEGFGDNPANEFSVGATPRVTMGFGTFNDSFTAVNTTFPADGSASTANNTTVTTISNDYSAALGFGLDVSAANSFYFEPAPIVEFGVAPTGFVSVASDPTDYQIVSSDSTVTTVDGTETANVTTTYANNDGGTPLSRDLTVGFGVSLPTGITIAPNNLPFEIMMGATPSISADVTWTTTQQGTVTVTNNVTETSSTTIVGAPGTTRDIDYSVFSIHRFGLGFDFAETVRFDVLLTGNLLDFNTLTMQGVIALP